ncbi:MAG: YARHG domain-containing protein [Bacteroidota bacterium]
MRSFPLLVFLLFLSISVQANSGAFFATGNHLIPIYENEISVKKEILSITRINREYIRVNVYYEFYNPGPPKTILVGFEAPSPYGDVDGTPDQGRHPYMHDFTVLMNGTNPGFETALVRDSNYYQNSRIQGLTEKEVKGEYFNVNAPLFYYVYHFEANFKPGLNRIIHNYMLKLSSSVIEPYKFKYILTAAKRWANRQIDDFTLLIDMGAFQDFSIRPTFFNSSKDWQCLGNGVIKDNLRNASFKSSDFFVQQGAIMFLKKNFRPEGELELFSTYASPLCLQQLALSPGCYLSFDLESQSRIPQPRNQEEYDILRNLPYARRGYPFTFPKIRAFYDKMPWYEPNPSYRAKPALLLPEEREWLNNLKIVGN